VPTQQFHLYVRHKFSATENVKTKFSHAELYQIVLEDNIECAFANVNIAFRIFLTLLVTNCSPKHSFSRLKYIKKSPQNKYATRHAGRLISIMYRSRCVTKD